MRPTMKRTKEPKIIWKRKGLREGGVEGGREGGREGEGVVSTVGVEEMIERNGWEKE